MIVSTVLLALIAGTLSVSGQRPSPCPEVFSYEPRGQEEDRWYGVLSLKSSQDLTGVWIRIKLDRPAELLGNWFGDATSTDNQEFTIRDSSYRLQAGTPVSVRFFVKYNSASTIPSLDSVRLNGVTVCPSGQGVEATTGSQLHISQRRPTGSGSSHSGGGANGNVDHNADVGVVTRPGSITPRPSSGWGSSGGSGNVARPNANSNTGRPSGSSGNNGRPSSGGNSGRPTRPTGGGTNTNRDQQSGTRRYQDDQDENDYFTGDFDNINNNNRRNNNNDNYDNTRPTNNNDEADDNNSWDDMDDRISPSNSRGVRTRNPSNNDNILFENSGTDKESSYETSNTRQPSNTYGTTNSNSYNNNNDYNTGRDPNYNNPSSYDNRPSGDNRRRPTSSFGSLDNDDDEDENPSVDYFPGDFAIVSPTINRPTSNTRNPINAVRVPQCGTVATGANALISHGQGTRPGEWPWHVALYHSRGIQLTYTCGGTLISQKHVITAAHCVTKVRTTQAISPQNVLAYLGKYNLKKFGSEVQDKEVSKIYIHPDFNATVYFNDIAILKLTEPAEITNYVRPCCLWDENEDFDDVLDELGTVVGWGFDENRRLSNELTKAQMPVVRNDKCIFSNREFFSQFTFEKTFCAGFRNGTSVCNGDSGGGMVFPKPGSRGSNVVWQLRGVVSVGVALQGEGVCDPSHYVVFADTAKHLDWIKGIMSRND